MAFGRRRRWLVGAEVTKPDACAGTPVISASDQKAEGRKEQQSLRWEPEGSATFSSAYAASSPDLIIHNNNGIVAGMGVNSTAASDEDRWCFMAERRIASGGAGVFALDSWWWIAGNVGAKVPKRTGEEELGTGRATSALCVKSVRRCRCPSEEGWWSPKPVRFGVGEEEEVRKVCVQGGGSHATGSIGYPEREGMLEVAGKCI